MGASGLRRELAERGAHMEGEDSPYRVDLHGDVYAVFDDKGEVVCVCGTETNARHYEVLLRQAYTRGFKAGYRAGKRA
jgi:hypothetical protein